MYRMGIAAEESEMAALRGAITGSTRTEEIELFPKKLFLFMIIPEFMVITAFLMLFWQ
jgi:F0F1-type ATP synthase membrane subunit c/vacuolar-type H+-ATPase subunit K